MIYMTHLHFKDGFGILYRFPRRGDGLPMHTHATEEEHDVTCTRGLIRVIIKDGRTRDLFPGEWVGDLDLVNTHHEVIALEDNSSCLNILTHGRPLSYVALPANELDRSYEPGPITTPLESI